MCFVSFDDDPRNEQEWNMEGGYMNDDIDVKRHKKAASFVLN